MAEPGSHEGLWDVEDVAGFLKCSRSFIYKAVQRGDLPCVRIGAMLRFRPAAIRGLVEGSRESSPAVIPFQRP